MKKVLLLVCAIALCPSLASADGDGTPSNHDVKRCWLVSYNWHDGNGLRGGVGAFTLTPMIGRPTFTQLEKATDEAGKKWGATTHAWPMTVSEIACEPTT